MTDKERTGRIQNQPRRTAAIDFLLSILRSEVKPPEPMAGRPHQSLRDQSPTNHYHLLAAAGWLLSWCMFVCSVFVHVAGSWFWRGGGLPAEFPRIKTKQCEPWKTPTPPNHDFMCSAGHPAHPHSHQLLLALLNHKIQNAVWVVRVQ